MSQSTPQPEPSEALEPAGGTHASAVAAAAAAAAAAMAATAAAVVPAHLWIAVDDPAQSRLITTLAQAHGIVTHDVPASETLQQACRRQRTAVPAHARASWIVELDRLHREAMAPGAFLIQVRMRSPDATLAICCTRWLEVGSFAEGWARSAGALDLVAGMVGAGRVETLEQELREIWNELSVAWDAGAARMAMAACSAPAADAAQAAAQPADRRLLARLEWLRDRGLTLAAIADWAQSGGGFDVRDRVWHMRGFPSSFDGREAVTRLAAQFSCDRTAAAEIGELLRRARYLQHVVKEHPFEDAQLYYRFTPFTARLRDVNAASLLAHATGRDGFPRRDRMYLGRTYRNCFVGAEAVQWLQRRYELTQEEALSVGQAMMDLGVLRHVIDEHEFKDASLFFVWTGFAAAMMT